MKRDKLIISLIAVGLLAFLTLLIGKLSGNELKGDEYRFFGYAEYLLLEGKYVMDSDGLLWNGPGLPMIMTPFVYFEVPILKIRLLNAFFLVAAFFVLQYLFRSFLSKKYALTLSLALVLFPAVLKIALVFYTEVLCFLLISILIYCFDRLHKRRSRLLVLGTAICFSYLVLTKIIFFFVLLILLLSSFVLKLRKGDPLLQQFSSAFSLSLIFILPYLLYTYQVSGKFPYLGNSGGMQIYWMTVDGQEHTGEWHPFPGDWNPFPASSTHQWSTGNYTNEVWYQENKMVIDEWKKLGPIEADSYLKQMAWQNIKSQPLIYLKNIYYNASRLILNIPRDQNRKAGKSAWLNFIFVIGIGFILFNLKKLLTGKHTAALFLLLFLGSYLFGSLLLCGYARFFVIVFPVIVYLCLVCWKSSSTHLSMNEPGLPKLP